MVRGGFCPAHWPRPSGAALLLRKSLVELLAELLKLPGSLACLDLLFRFKPDPLCLEIRAPSERQAGQDHPGAAGSFRWPSAGRRGRIGL